MKNELLFLTTVLVPICLSACDNPFNHSSKLLRSADKAQLKQYSEIYKEPNKTLISKFNSYCSSFSKEYLSTFNTSNVENSLCSPISSYFALALAGECTNNNTRNEILNCLDNDIGELRSTSDLIYCLSQKEYKNGLSIVSKELLTNSIWSSNEFAKNEQCLKDLASYYYCDSYEADFLNNNDGANKAIQNYVKDKTNGLINKNFEFDEATRVVLMNTLYMKDVWSEFGDNLSFTDKEYSFKQADGSTKETKLLNGYKISAKTYKNDQYSSMYTKTEHGYRLFFIKPNDGYTLKNVMSNTDNIANAYELDNYANEDPIKKVRYYTTTYFPEFKLEQTKNIASIYKKLGVNDLFDSCNADFSTLTEEKIFATEVVHSTKLEVNKKGIEGAAVTAMANATSCGPDEYKEIFEEFYVDKNFGLIVTDTYNLPLFVGVVNKL